MADIPNATNERIDPALASALRLDYTTPEMVFYRLDIDGTNTLLVIGGDGEGAYEWVALKGGAVEKHSDCGYGMSDIALRDGLIFCFGLPPDDGYFMREIAPKREPSITPSTKRYIDRSDAVNLARTIRETDNIENVTRRGWLSLVDAVLRMDEFISATNAAPQGPEASAPSFVAGDTTPASAAPNERNESGQ